MGLDIFDSSEGVPEFYADSARMHGNAFTITIEFGIQTAAAEGEPLPPPTRRNVVVRMSPQHALALRDMLVRNLDKYAALIGQEIPYPKLEEDEGAIGLLAAPQSPAATRTRKSAKKQRR